jgi:prevent-host-death family protein
MPLTEARQRLSPLVRRLARHPIPISVRGQVRAYLVSAERFEELEALERAKARGTQKRIQGTLDIAKDLEEGSKRAAKEFESWSTRGKRDRE